MLPLQKFCFSPLAGIRFVESRSYWVDRTTNSSFSPLAGIRFVESQMRHEQQIDYRTVSVPLRGLGSWKVWLNPQAGDRQYVSVPLRGLGSWKARRFRRRLHQEGCFSPLAGIRFVESRKIPAGGLTDSRFQSPCGD